MPTLDRHQARCWLFHKLSPDPMIISAYLFGSFLNLKADPSDVDLLCVLTQREVKQWSSAIKQDFFEQFSLRLHLQRFHANEGQDVGIFLKTATIWEKVV